MSRPRTRAPGPGLSYVAATLHFHFRKSWRELKRGRPGHRFQDRYERARRTEADTCTAERVVMLVAGIIALLIGGFFAIFPGPALPFFFAGGGLLASESRVIARIMDWSEIRVRKVFGWGKRQWRRMPALARVGVVFLGACLSAGTMYFSYRLFR